MKSLIVSAAALAALTFTHAEADARGAQEGIASWYSAGHRTASGERFNPSGMTAAHRTLPFGSRVLVRHAKTGRSVVVRINDRGPFIRGRSIDLARGAAQRLGMIRAGAARVTIAVIGRVRGARS